MYERYLCEQFLEEGADECGDLVSVQQVEATMVVAVVVHDAVGVAVERTAPLARLHNDAFITMARDDMDYMKKMLTGSISVPPPRYVFARHSIYMK